MEAILITIKYYIKYSTGLTKIQKIEVIDLHAREFLETPEFKTIKAGSKNDPLVYQYLRGLRLQHKKNLVNFKKGVYFESK